MVVSLSLTRSGCCGCDLSAEGQLVYPLLGLGGFTVVLPSLSILAVLVLLCKCLAFYVPV